MSARTAMSVVAGLEGVALGSTYTFPRAVGVLVTVVCVIVCIVLACYVFVLDARERRTGGQS